MTANENDQDFHRTRDSMRWESAAEDERPNRVVGQRSHSDAVGIAFLV